MVAIDVTKCHHSAIAIVEAKCPGSLPGRDKRVAREALWWIKAIARWLMQEREQD